MAKPWRIQWDEHRWGVDDLGAAGMVACQALVDDGWQSFDPTRSPAHLAAVAAVLLAAASGRPVGDVYQMVIGLPSERFLALLQYEDGES